MAFGLKLRKYPKAEIDARVDEAARILGMVELLDRRPKALSGGQRQRVAVGRAIVRKPAVFLFDEPLSNLDAKMRVQMRVEISRLHSQLRTTMIYVTHDQVEAMTMGQRIVVMKDGVVQQVADPISLYDKPANLFVAGFIGMPPMNFIEGIIRRKASALVFERPGGMQVAVPGKDKAALAVFCEKEVTLGVRPEDIGSAAAEAEVDAPRIRATVDVVELMGSESNIYFRVGNTTFISRVDAHWKHKIGDVVDSAIYVDKVNFFDRITEKRIVGVS